MARKRYGRLNTVEDLKPIFADMRKIRTDQEELKALHGIVISNLKKMLATAEKTLKRLLDRRNSEYNRLEVIVVRFSKRKREHLLSLQSSKTVRVDETGTIKFSFNPEHIVYEGKGDKEAEDAIVAQMEATGNARFVRVIKEINVEALEQEPSVANKLGFFWERDEKITIKP